ncbi:MAG: hypothetical protein JWN30_769 [Bacilli bacterium]|nr:hypothetical protein [Bacilli bacterium]
MQNRREIILAEIEYWKKNRLLPAAYCDFLVNLYTEGKSASSAARPARNVSRRYLWASGAALLIAFGVWAWYRLPQWAHFAVAILAAAALAGIGLRQNRESRVRFVFGCLSSMLFLVAGWLLWEFHQFPLYGRNYGSQQLIWLMPSLAALALTKGLTAVRNPAATVTGVFVIVPLFVPEGIVLTSSGGTLVVYSVLCLKLAVGICLFVVYRSKIQAWWTTAAGKVSQGM